MNTAHSIWWWKKKVAPQVYVDMSYKSREAESYINCFGSCFSGDGGTHEDVYMLKGEELIS